MEPMHKRLLITITLAIILITGFFLITNAITKYTGFSVTDKSIGSDFEICLGKQDITLYINTETPAQKVHDMELSKYANLIKIIDCSGNNNICLQNQVNSFPTWIINGNKIQKDIGISELTKFSGCSLIE
jgi:hypothetical protein